MVLVKAYAGALIAFLVIDIVWITLVVRPMYDQQVGGMLRETPQMVGASLFYLAYAAGIVYFAVLPALSEGGLGAALLKGAVFGVLAYGTYAFTNYAVLDGWTMKLVVADVVWGGVLTAMTAAAGLYCARLGGA